MRNTRHLFLCAVLVPFLVIVLEFAGFAAHKFQIFGNTISDPDTLMRLAYLRVVWASGNWDYGFFIRNNAPYGMVLHWTLPFNIFILGFAKACFFLSPEQALQFAGYWTGPIFCVAVAFAAYWAARQILLPGPSALVAALITFSPFLLSNYGMQGEANHHALLYLDTVLMAGFSFVVAGRPGHAQAALLVDS